jgi:uncharacterized membrane protein YqgA involved in biofilm formation
MLGTEVGLMGFRFRVVAHFNQFPAASSNVQLAFTTIFVLFLVGRAAMFGPYQTAMRVSRDRLAYHMVLWYGSVAATLASGNTTI